MPDEPNTSNFFGVNAETEIGTSLTFSVRLRAVTSITSMPTTLSAFSSAITEPEMPAIEAKIAALTLSASDVFLKTFIKYSPKNCLCFVLNLL